MSKKITSVILALIMALSCCCIAFFSASADSSFTVTAGFEVESADALQTVDWFPGEDGSYFFFIPSYWGAAELNVWTSAPAQINGQDFESGSVIDLGESGTITSGGTEYKYTVVCSSGVGTVFINTQSGSLDSVHADKNYKEPGEISIRNAGGKEQTKSTVLEYIKGRGNASWNAEKKPYNIKLDKKAGILGMESSKKWCLIANDDDRTLMRNAMVYNAAADAGLEYSPENAPVDLFINGEYRGAYLLTSKVEVASKRINVKDLDEVNEEICVEQYGEDFDMDTIKIGGVYGKYAGLIEGNCKYAEIPESEKNTADGGYVLEMEIANRYSGDLTGFVSNDGQPFVMKSPEYASKAQMEYISGYYQRFEDAVKSEDGKNADGESYTDLIDTESFAKYYTISEWTANMDTGLTSTYFYLDTTKDGLLYAGPVWDYDIALGNNGDARYGLDYTDPEQFTVCFGRQYRNTVFGTLDVDEKPTVFNYLCQKEDFAAECKTQWDSSVYEAVSAWCGDNFNEYADTIYDSAIMNHIRWNSFRTQNPEEVGIAYSDQVSALKVFASTRAEFLNANLGKVQKNPVKTDFFTGILKKIGTGINNAFEKMIVLFHLENK
ncbi:MAG: CotH kinase family protein [Clostridia bacterium]|nr:CotH kinase family protein [Clostridia bacterium]